MKNLSVVSESGMKINKTNVHKLVSLIKKELGFVLEQLQIVFVNSEGIKNINVEFLKHDYSTDIITFSYSEEKMKFDGEIYISVEDAKENAKKFGVSLNNEIIRLIIHGILHLLGYNDIDKKEKAVMKKMENKLVDSFKTFDKKNKVIHDR